MSGPHVNSCLQSKHIYVRCGQMFLPIILAGPWPWLRMNGYNNPYVNPVAHQARVLRPMFVACSFFESHIGHFIVTGILSVYNFVPQCLQ